MSIEQKIAQILAESLAENQQGQSPNQGVPSMGVSPYDPNMGLQGAVSNTLAQYSDPSVNVPVQPVDTGSVPGNMNPFNSDEGAGQAQAQPPVADQGQEQEQPETSSPPKGQPQEDDEDEDDEKNDEEDDDEVQRNKNLRIESVDVSQDIEALVEGENLSEEFKEKAATIFEAAVITRVRSEVTKISENYNTQLNKEVEKLKEGLVDKVDGYLDYVVEQWFEQNEIALESGMKSEIVEGFIYGLKNLFEEHYIDVPEEKFDVMESLENEVNELKTRLNEQIDSTVKLRTELNNSKAKEIVSEIAKGLTETDKEKFNTLTEDLTFDNEDSYKKKVQTIRESYFKNNKAVGTVPVINPTVNYVINNDPVQINEEKVYPTSMKSYLTALDKYVK